MFVVLTKLTNRHDVWVAETGRCFGLAQKSLDALIGVALIELGDFDGDGAIEQWIVRFVNIAKGSRA